MGAGLAGAFLFFGLPLPVGDNGDLEGVEVPVPTGGAGGAEGLGLDLILSAML